MTCICLLRLNAYTRFQIKFLIDIALQGLGWTDIHDLPPYGARCALIRLETLCSRREYPTF
jgi:hypothetical protein